MKCKILKITCLITFVIFVLSNLCFVKAINAENETKTALLGKIIYIDAGHGGKDNGASFNGVLEDEINLKIAGYLIEELIDLGAYVLTSRTGDYDLSNIYDKNKKRNDLINRVTQINKSKVDLFLSIHLNSYSSETISGAQVFYQNNENSKLLANTIQDKLNELIISKDRKTKLGDYYILRKTDRPGILIECGFLSNTQEREMLLKSDYQHKLSNKIIQGIINYFHSIEN